MRISYKLSERLKYCDVTFRCIHGGKNFKSRGTVHDTLPKTTSPKRHFAETTQCRKICSDATLRRKFQMINTESCSGETNVIGQTLIVLMGT